jgi:hypothetical protein
MSAVADARAAGLVVRPTRIPNTTAVAYPDGSVDWIRADGFRTHFTAEQWKNMWIERHLRHSGQWKAARSVGHKYEDYLDEGVELLEGAGGLVLLVMGAVAAYVVACLPFLIFTEGDLPGWMGLVAVAEVIAVAGWWMHRLDKRDAAESHVFRASDGCALDCNVCGQDVHEARHVG